LPASRPWIDWLNRTLFGSRGLNVSGFILLAPPAWSLRRVSGVFLAGEIFPALILGGMYASDQLHMPMWLLVTAQPLAVIALMWLVRPPTENSPAGIFPLDIDFTSLLRYAASWGLVLRVISLLVVMGQVAVGFWEDVTNNPLLLAEEPLGIVEQVIIVFSAVILVPIAEELFYRGLLYRSLGRRFNLTAAAFVSTAVWTFLHGPVVLYPVIFVLGIFLTLLYESTGSIWAPIAAHMGFNLTSFLLMWILPGVV